MKFCTYARGLKVLSGDNYWEGFSVENPTPKLPKPTSYDIKTSDSQEPSLLHEPESYHEEGFCIKAFKWELRDFSGF